MSEQSEQLRIKSLNAGMSEREREKVASESKELTDIARQHRLG
jgi:hypothetical protein